MSGELLPLRVMVQDVWGEVELAFDATHSVGELKRAALTRSHVRRDPSAYLVKYRGAELLDEAGSLAQAGIVPNANLIDMPRRRRPVG
jgi:hypothetical protein